jgi:hypothetical protein
MTLCPPFSGASTVSHGHLRTRHRLLINSLALLSLLTPSLLRSSRSPCVRLSRCTAVDQRPSIAVDGHKGYYHITIGRRRAGHTRPGFGLDGSPSGDPSVAARPAHLRRSRLPSRTSSGRIPTHSVDSLRSSFVVPEAIYRSAFDPPVRPRYSGRSRVDTTVRTAQRSAGPAARSPS